MCLSSNTFAGAGVHVVRVRAYFGARENQDREGSLAGARSDRLLPGLTEQGGPGLRPSKSG